jgi:twitching motility protein PilU
MTPEQANKTINDLLRMMLQHHASDLFIADDFPPAMKINGKLTPVGNQKLNGVISKALAYSVMRVDQQEEFEREYECNFAINPEGIGRFRVNVFMQQEKVGMVMRVITSKIPDFDELKLPPVLKDVVLAKRGLVLLVGGTGSGKSTTMAAMIDYRNQNTHGHTKLLESNVTQLNIRSPDAEKMK